MTMSGLAANRRPRIVAPRSPRITYLGFYKGGRGARSDSKAADWNYDHCTTIKFILGERFKESKLFSEQKKRIGVF